MLQGIYPIVVTPFHADGRVDLNGQLRVVDHLMDEGAHGLGLFGNASEGYALTGEERSTLARTIVRHVNGRVPIVASSGHTGTDAAVESSRRMEDLGADALMVLPPHYMKTDADGLVHYFRSIGEAVHIPIMVQDAPLMTQVAIPAGLIARLAREAPNVRYAKIEAPPTAPKISAVREAAGDSMTLFGGLNCQFLIEEYNRGARGMMPGSDLTAELVEIWQSLQAGAVEEAWQAFTAILPLLRFELQPGLGVSAMKHNLVARGVIASARVRHPTADLDRHGIAELKTLRDRLPLRSTAAAPVR